MGKVDVIKIYEKVLERLSIMAYEKNDEKRKVFKSKFLELNKQLIFPLKIQAKATKIIDRISEQELRQLFIEEFKTRHPEFFYSIETPTQEKYKFGKSYADIVENVNIHKVSASLDMCVFNIDEDKKYERILNIEFKHKNTKDKNIAKDVLKLMREKQNGVFILLLNNTRKGNSKGTLWNEKNTGVFNKLYKSFNDFQTNWNGEDKYIQLVVMSLNQNRLIHRKIRKTDLDNLKNIFFIESGCGNIMDITEDSWRIKVGGAKSELGMVVEEREKY